MNDFRGTHECAISRKQIVPREGRLVRWLLIIPIHASDKRDIKLISDIQP